MKKNMKKILSLFMAAAIFATSGTVVSASQAEPPASETEAGSGNSTNTDNANKAGTKAGVGDAAGSDSSAGSSDASGTGSTDGKTSDGSDAGGTGSTDSGAGSSTSSETGNTNGAADQNTGTNNAPVEGTVTDQSGEEGKTSGGTEAPVQGTIITDENNDDIKIKESDKPYLSLGADLSDAQRATVLSIMGIDPVNLSNYDVVYVTNAEEHQYLDEYISSSQIGSKSLSSVLIVKRDKGNGLNISSNNITYCTVGMYKNALATAGITDADIIIAGPTGISGTAALVGIFKAYQEMTGETIGENVIDAALNELVITGQLEASIEGLTDEEVEEFIAYIKSVIAQNDLSDEASINEAIDEACERYGVTLSDEERQQIVDLLLKITSLGIDLNGLVDFAESMYNSFKNGNSDGVFAAIGNFFSNIFTSIGDFFKNLFS